MASFFSFYEEKTGQCLTINLEQICSLHLDHQDCTVVTLANGEEHTLSGSEAALLDQRIAQIDRTYPPLTRHDDEQE